MRRVEDGGLLDAQADQLVDVEEPAVVDVALRGAPERELVVLAAQQSAQLRASLRAFTPRLAERLVLGVVRKRGRVDRELVVEVAHQETIVALLINHRAEDHN